MQPLMAWAYLKLNIPYKTKKMQNQIFDIKRFGSYSKYMLLVNWKKRALTIGTLLVIFSAIITLNLQGHWGFGQILAIGIPSLIVAGIMLVAAAFPNLRTKESIIQYLTIPASNLEKFLAELISRVGTLLLTPFVMKVVGNATIKVHAKIEALRYGFETPKSYTLFSREIITLDQKELSLVILAILVVASIIFTGTTVFKKNAFLKTILFVGFITASVAGYFLFLSTTFFPAMSRSASILHRAGIFNKEFPTIWSIITLSIIMVWSLSYAFFKLKEKEI